MAGFNDMFPGFVDMFSGDEPVTNSGGSNFPGGPGARRLPGTYGDNFPGGAVRPQSGGSNFPGGLGARKLQYPEQMALPPMPSMEMLAQKRGLAMPGARQPMDPKRAYLLKSFEDYRNKNAGTMDARKLAIADQLINNLRSGGMKAAALNALYDRVTKLTPLNIRRSAAAKAPAVENVATNDYLRRYEAATAAMEAQGGGRYSPAVINARRFAADTMRARAEEAEALARQRAVVPRPYRGRSLGSLVSRAEGGDSSAEARARSLGILPGGGSVLPGGRKYPEEEPGIVTRLSRTFGLSR